MHRFVFCLVTALAAFAADPNTWNKVKELKGGTEIRILKKSSMQPVLGKFADASDDNLVLVVKNEEIAIPREQIDRLDYRPSQNGSRMKKETKTTVEDPHPGEPRQGMNGQQTGAGGYSSTTTFSSSSKPDFETLYRRPAAPSKK